MPSAATRHKIEGLESFSTATFVLIGLFSVPVMLATIVPECGVAHSTMQWLQLLVGISTAFFAAGAVVLHIKEPLSTPERLAIGFFLANALSFQSKLSDTIQADRAELFSAGCFALQCRLGGDLADVKGAPDRREKLIYELRAAGVSVERIIPGIFQQVPDGPRCNYRLLNDTLRCDLHGTVRPVRTKCTKPRVPCDHPVPVALR